MQTEAQRRWTRLIHVAKNQTGIDDDAYRAILAGSAGVASAAEIKTWAQFGAVMRAFRNLGFTPRRPQVEPQGGRNPHWMTARQEYYIKGLWRLVSKSKDEGSLRAFVRRITGSDDIKFLRKGDAMNVITALRRMAMEAGYNPDCKGGCHAADGV
ncbi:MAG: regulatory protein GemA [Treponema sp.]|nr:regulatory protein GemA [Treponema sp.]